MHSFDHHCLPLQQAFVRVLEHSFSLPLFECSQISLPPPLQTTSTAIRPSPTNEDDDPDRFTSNWYQSRIQNGLLIQSVLVVTATTTLSSSPPSPPCRRHRHATFPSSSPRCHHRSASSTSSTSSSTRLHSYFVVGNYYSCRWSYCSRGTVPHGNQNSAPSDAQPPDARSASARASTTCP